MTLAGIDVSQAQGAIDWRAVAGAHVDGRPLRFAIAKATEGPRYVDPTFAANWRGTRAVGLRRGAYAFARPESGLPEVQAECLVRAIDAAGGLLRSDLPPALDLEEARGIVAGEAFVRWTLGFLRRLEDLTGRRPILYTGGPFFDQHDGDPSPELIAQLQLYPLWLAAYVRTPDEFLPPEWRAIGWTFWQRSGDVAAPGNALLHVPGIGGGKVNVDRNEFRGDDAGLDAFIARSILAPTREPGLRLDTLDAAATTLADEAHRLGSIFDEPVPDTVPEGRTAKSSQRLAAVRLDADQTWPKGTP